MRRKSNLAMDADTCILECMNLPSMDISVLKKLGLPYLHERLKRLLVFPAEFHCNCGYKNKV